MLSKEEMKRFAEVAEQDKDFAEKITAAMKAKNIDEVIRLAAEKGFTFTAEDFDFQGKRELDLDELKQVAAGGASWDEVDEWCGDAELAGCVLHVGVAFW